MDVKGHVTEDGEIYAVLPCSRREIVRAWRGAGVGVATLVSALAHPGERFVHLGNEPPDAEMREPRRPCSPRPGSGIALAPPEPDLAEI
jgi:hypothetical protein